MQGIATIQQAEQGRRRLQLLCGVAPQPQKESLKSLPSPLYAPSKALSPKPKIETVPSSILSDPPPAKGLVKRVTDQLGPVTAIHWNAYAHPAGKLESRWSSMSINRIVIFLGVAFYLLVNIRMQMVFFACPPTPGA